MAKQNQSSSSAIHLSGIDLTAIVIWILPVLYLIYVFPALPESVPMHFDAKGRADDFGSKSNHLLIMIGLAVFNILIYLLVRNVNRLDPKAINSLSTKTYRNLALAILIFLSAIHLIITHSTAQGELSLDKALLALMGFFFAYLGWIMKEIQPNYFIGIRTPWTLEDRENWKATHSMGSRYFFWGGLFIALAAFILGRPAGLIVCISALLVITLIPLTYSYLFFRKKRNEQ